MSQGPYTPPFPYQITYENNMIPSNSLLPSFEGVNQAKRSDFQFSTLEEFARKLIHPAAKETSGGAPRGFFAFKKASIQNALIHTYMHACMHAYIHTGRHNAHTDTDADIQTYRHTDIHTYRHTDIQTHRHTYRHTNTHT